jgi:hypothetical protein
MVRVVSQRIALCIMVAGVVGQLLALEPGALPHEVGAEGTGYSAADLRKWEQPSQFRNPVGFWSGRRVIQKRGIVIEDRDHIVRERYWVLDEYATGNVVEVSLVSTGARLRVRFISKAG